MATSTVAQNKHRGGSFLIESSSPEEIFTPEDFTEEHRAIARTTEEFFTNEVAPAVEAIQHHEPGVAVSLLRKSGELGLTGAEVPERYGGMEMDLVSMMIIGEQLGRDGSYATWHAAQVGIGTLPLLLFGTEEQKQRYLPKLASADLIAAYCLTEAQAGSDALAARTRADLTPDGKYYILNGQKMWITNGGAADLFTVFAKVDGEKFTAFLVERGWPGVQPGAEEKKMGIKGSSTTAVYLDNVRVPVENVLGEVGRGHIIAFNILNLGRLKLGPIAVGGAKEVIRLSLKYAKERHTFGKPIASYGMIQHKLAEMAIRTYAAESLAYRVVGLIEDQLAGLSWDQPDASKIVLKAAEEYAIECSYAKLFCSEALSYVTDEGVQVHGGYGYHQDYAVERAYRDSRINRIFEGTNEINRLLATGMLLKRAQKGVLPLVEAVKKLQAEVLGGPQTSGNAESADAKLVANAKKVALFVLGIAYLKYLNGLEEQQEIVAGITDISMNVFAMESALLRAGKMAAHGKGEVARDMAAVFLHEAMDTIEAAARTILAACSEGDALRTNLAVLKRFTKSDPVNSIALRRCIAGRLLQAERYVVLSPNRSLAVAARFRSVSEPRPQGSGLAFDRGAPGNLSREAVLKIIVCIKQVPARDSQLRIDSSGRWIEEGDLNFEINEPDAYALEAGLQLKEKHGGEVVALCAGPGRASQTIREALAKGADRALHIEDEQVTTWGTLAIARLLAKAIAPEKPDLVLTGLQSDDLGYGQTGVVLAETLGMPHATIIMSVEMLNGKLRVKREMESGWFQNIEMPLPAVLTIQSGFSKLRYATLMGIKKAKTKEVRKLTAAGLGVTASPAATVERVYLPQKTKQTQLLEGSAKEVAAKLVEKLKFEVRAI